MHFNTLAKSGRLAIFTGALLLSTGAAIGQEGHFISVEDNGEGPMVTHFVMPDMFALRKPDFEPRDLELFNEKLLLEEFQQPLVKSLLDDYLEAFAKLADEIFPASQGRQFMTFGFGDEDGEGRGGAVGFIMPELDIDLGELNEDITSTGPGELRIEIAARIGDGEGGEGGVVVAGGDGDVAADGVTIQFDADGDVPEELREKLEAMAEEMAERLQERLENAEENGDLDVQFGPPPNMEEMQARMEEMKQKAEHFKKDKAALRDKFVQDVQALLTDGQMSRWPSLERALTRHKTLPDGRLDGERTDLLEVLTALELSDQQYESLQELMDGYEVTLHDALVARNSYVPQAQRDVDEAIKASDPEGALRAVDRATRLRLNVRRINEQFADSMVAQLGDETGQAFREAFHKRSYPRVYGRRTTAQRAFARAMALEGINDEVHEAIVGLEQSYLLELEPMKEQLRQTIHKHQPNEPRRGIEGIAEALAGEGSNSFSFSSHNDDPIHKAFKKRTSLDERYMKQLYALLDEEQVKSLPRLPSDRPSSFTIRRVLGDPNDN